jgi:hypothetical protein
VPEELSSRRRQKKPQCRLESLLESSHHAILCSDMAAEELAALVKEREKLAGGSRNGPNAEDSSGTTSDSGFEPGTPGFEDQPTSDTSPVDHPSEDCPQEDESLLVTAIPEAKTAIGTTIPDDNIQTKRPKSDVTRKAENRKTPIYIEQRKSWKPDNWNLKVPQGIPPHIAESAFELYDQELKNMPDKAFKEFLQDWSPDSPMYLYLQELRVKVR